MSRGEPCVREDSYTKSFSKSIIKSQQSSFPQIGKQTKTEMEMLQMSSCEKINDTDEDQKDEDLFIG